MRFAISIAILLGFLAQRVSLEQVEAAIRRGDAQQARALLDRWQKANPNARDAHAVFLHAKLTLDADSAEIEYLQVAVSFSTSAYAAESLFRLGQARDAAGDMKQAKIYFKRVVSDFPQSEFAAQAKRYLKT